MIEIEQFPYTYDQFQRYAVLRKFLEFYHPENTGKILDAGGISPERKGSSFWLPVKKIYSGPAYAVDKIFYKSKGYIQGSGLRLPFEDGAFKAVSALDVIEHVRREKRAEFIAEMCRVSGGAVILSAPFKDSKIEETEKLLFEQIKDLYGIEHGPLKEHRAMGLPGREEIEKILNRHISRGIGFSFGSLNNWLVFQSIKNCFQARENSAFIHSFLDKWEAANRVDSEFEPPYSRHFWIYAKDMSRDQLNKAVIYIKKNLRKDGETEADFAECRKFHRALVDFYQGPQLTALVVSEGKINRLKNCLKHILTQKTFFDMTVKVWDIKADSKLNDLLQSDFPGVEYFNISRNARTTNALLKAVDEAKGQSVLLLSEDILLPQNAVNQLYKELHDSETEIISPRIIRDTRFYSVWGGTRLSFKRFLAGRRVNPFWKFSSSRLSWIYSECLLFKREALWKRKWRNKSLKKKNIFFWEQEGPEKRIKYCPDIVVYKKIKDV